MCRAVCGGGQRQHVFTILLVPAKSAHEDVIEALKLGVDDFLAKPIVLGELLARLRAAARVWNSSDACRPFWVPIRC